MSVSLSKKRYGYDPHGRRFGEADVTFDSSYPTGGEALSPPDFGLTNVVAVEITFIAMPDKQASSYTLYGKQVVPSLAAPTAPKLLVYTAADTEATNASDQSGIVVRVRCIGQ